MTVKATCAVQERSRNNYRADIGLQHAATAASADTSYQQCQVRFLTLKSIEQEGFPDEDVPGVRLV
ncbi:hypothetical protein RvY_04146 [Ramazzottius varieornatus]|uniref:Uncharacterized protein n=1 Tax=Ramazzottius varieornatus TaxID=947166 RepID=A0A1D1UZW9_RAMVA|nr:hypothetical protein RvY_04146 [Ramazzottius varieornatus]